MQNLLLKNLMVLQADLRHRNDIQTMAEYVKNGGYWTKECLEEYSKSQKLTRISPVIAISQFEDGLQFIHDGLHRSVSTWLGGRDYLRPDEFVLTNWKYEEYEEISPQNNWYTPFNPKIHLRVADLSVFKKEAKEKFKADLEAATEWLWQNSDKFRVNRIGVILNIPQFSQRFYS